MSGPVLSWSLFPPQNCPFMCGNLDPMWHVSSGQPETTSQTSSRSIQPFLQGSWSRRTNRQTDHATLSVTIGCIYVRSTVMRPNNGPLSCQFHCSHLIWLWCINLSTLTMTCCLPSVCFGYQSTCHIEHLTQTSRCYNVTLHQLWQLYWFADSNSKSVQLLLSTTLLTFVLLWVNS